MNTPVNTAPGAITSRSVSRNTEELLTKMGPTMLEALPKHLSVDRMMRISITALRTTKKLQDCTPGSFLAAVLNASIMGLEVNTQAAHSYLVPFQDKQKVLQCSLIIGYKGMMELARRSKQIRLVQAFAAYKGDAFDYELGLEPKLIHRPGEGSKADENLTHTYGIARLEHGDPIFEVMNLEDIAWYRSKSKAPNGNFWKDSFAPMAKKTAIRRLYTWLPCSSEMAVAQVIESRADAGRPQAYASPEVADLLLGQGIELPDDTEESENVPAVATPDQDGKKMRLVNKDKPPAMRPQHDDPEDFER